MINLKLCIMSIRNRHCGNCKHNDDKYCQVPVKRFNPFKGLEITPYDRECVMTVGKSQCKWSRKDD